MQDQMRTMLTTFMAQLNNPEIRNLVTKPTSNVDDDSDSARNGATPTSSAIFCNNVWQFSNLS